MKGKACFQGETKSLGVGELGLCAPGWALSPEPPGSLVTQSTRTRRAPGEAQACPLPLCRPRRRG